MADADHNQVHGGKTVYGASVGILMLETRFPLFQATSDMPRPGHSRCFTRWYAAPPLNA